MIHDNTSALIIVEQLAFEDNPNAVVFSFESVDQMMPTSQQLIDALADYLLLCDADSFRNKSKKNDTAN